MLARLFDRFVADDSPGDQSFVHYTNAVDEIERRQRERRADDAVMMSLAVRTAQQARTTALGTIICGSRDHPHSRVSYGLL